MPQESVLVYSDTAVHSATFQIRIRNPLEEQGFKVIPADDYRCAPRLLAQVVANASSVITQRAIKKRCKLYATLLELARHHGVPVIFDTDDLLIDVPESHPDHAVYQRRKLHALKPLLDADLAVASTPELAKYLAPFQETLVLANQLPAALWRTRGSSSSDSSDATPRPELTIGYVGTRTHAADLQMVENAILRVLEQRSPAVGFLSVGVPLSPKLRGHRHARVLMPAKSIQHDYSEFARFALTLSIDVGIAPLLDTPFNRCKSDLKFLEYAAMGVPGVFSALPPYRRIRHGANGFLATNRRQWEDCLNELLNSADLRRKVAASAGEELATAGVSPAPTTWTQIIQQAREPRSERAGERLALSAVVDDLFVYQMDLQRQLRWTFNHQIKNYVRRLRRKLAA
jgi:hypothetical protein